MPARYCAPAVAAKTTNKKTSEIERTSQLLGFIWRSSWWRAISQTTGPDAARTWSTKPNLKRFNPHPSILIAHEICRGQGPFSGRCLAAQLRLWETPKGVIEKKAAHPTRAPRASVRQP